MTSTSNRSLFIAAAALMVALPAGMAVSNPVEIPDSHAQATPQDQAIPHGQTTPQGQAAPQVPYVVQAMPCGSRTDVVKMLRENFGETPVAKGLAATGAVAEVFLSSKGSWTIVATSPNGMSCMVGSGEQWQPAVAKDGTI